MYRGGTGIPALAKKNSGNPVLANFYSGILGFWIVRDWEIKQKSFRDPGFQEKYSGNPGFQEKYSGNPGFSILPGSGNFGKFLPGFHDFHQNFPEFRDSVPLFQHPYRRIDSAMVAISFQETVDDGSISF